MPNTAAITRRANRRKRDAYFTPLLAIDTLYKQVPEISGKILEPCAGEGAIANCLQAYGLVVEQTDIANGASYDATKKEYWLKAGCFDWIITNPPFNCASQILPYAHENAKIGVAFLLRLSYLEPCADRGEWLAEHPPNKLIIMPRISFTSDGKTDSCTTAWFVWISGSKQQEIIVIPKTKTKP